MKVLDLNQSLDVSNFETLAANAKNPVVGEAQVRAAHEAALRTQIDQIREYAKTNASGPLVRANKDLLYHANVET